MVYPRYAGAVFILLQVSPSLRALISAGPFGRLPAVSVPRDYFTGRYQRAGDRWERHGHALINLLISSQPAFHANLQKGALFNPDMADYIKPEIAGFA